MTRARKDQRARGETHKPRHQVPWVHSRSLSRARPGHNPQNVNRAMDLNTNHSARNMNSGTSRRGLLITLGASLLIVALISYSLRAIRAGSLYSSPTAIRDTNTLFRLQKPPETKPETDWTVFEQMAVSNHELLI